MNVIYNIALEFYGFLSTYIGMKIEKEKEEYNLPADKRIEEILDEVDQEISPFLKHDIELFFNKMFITLWLLFYFIREYTINNDAELIEQLTAMPPDEFRKMFMGHLHIDDKPYDQLTQKEINEGISSSFFHSSRTQAKMVHQLLHDPGEWQGRIMKTLKAFHEEHYLPYREELLKIGEARARKAEKLLNDDSTHFLDTLTMGHYKEILQHSQEVTVYLSYTYDRGMMISIKKELIIIGLTREMLLTSANRRLQTDNLFNALSDKKRIEVLRLLRKREWFSNEMAKHFGLTAATMSYHLGKLVSSGLVSIRIGDQKKAYYRINRENLENFLDCARADLLGEGDCMAGAKAPNQAGPEE